MRIVNIMYKSDFGVTIRKAMIKRKHSLMRMLMLPEKSILWIVQLYITAYGQIETFDNEHTVYTTVKIGDKEATLGTSEIPGQVTCYILIWEDAGVSCTIMGDGSLDELMKVAESIC